MKDADGYTLTSPISKCINKVSLPKEKQKSKDEKTSPADEIPEVTLEPESLEPPADQPAEDPLAGLRRNPLKK